MHSLITLICLVQVFSTTVNIEPVSKTIAEVLWEPLPAEDLSCIVSETEIAVQGPTFRYTVNRNNGTVSKLEALREGKRVLQLREPTALWLDDANLAAGTGGITQVLADGPAQVVLSAEHVWAPGIPCTVRTTIYNDGVLVSEITIIPETDVELRQGIRYEVNAVGRFTHYLHKRRDTNGIDCFKGALPSVAETVRMDTPTSCLEVFSSDAALALFTDMGDFYRSPATLDTAAVRMDAYEGTECVLGMHQHVIHVGPDGTPYTLRAGKAFTFRTGLAVAPNRLPHPRWRDLRMFIWVGDEKSPYPFDEEIWAAARLGFTLFQMHRLGPPGEPRPPAEELDRVIRTVHDAGMLFIWTANADLQYRHDSRVAKLVADGQWACWQGFNYGGQYKASMDAFCDTLSTCLASPNGLADYRIACKKRMLDRYPVDGMYIDDNLAYANCTLWKEHGHPQQVYDCLIELHDMNWRRRQLLRERCPHAVLIDHSSHAFVLPVISSFDCHLFGEGYTFPSVEEFRETFGSYSNMYAQGSLWAGDSETERCGVEAAYVFDLLTGGGQYSYLDWRLWPEKFPYASGVNVKEPLFVSTYNTVQYNFGLYESEFLGPLDTIGPGTYAALYHNRVWDENLVVLANMNNTEAACSLAAPDALTQSLGDGGNIVVYDVHQRNTFNEASGQERVPFVNVQLRPYQARLLYLRTIPKAPVYHLWGGKRLAERWEAETGKLSLLLNGPAGLEDWVVLGTGGSALGEVTVNAHPGVFYSDPDRGLVYGKVTFGREPVLLEANYLSEGGAPEVAGTLPEKAITPDRLTMEYFSK